MKVQIFLGILISGLALWLSMHEVPLSRMLDALRGASYGWLLPSMVFTMLGYLVRAYRWRFLLLPMKAVSTGSLFRATTIGFMANIVLPARLGELVRPYVLGRREGISKTGSFATIVVERIFDVSTLLLCFGVILLLYPSSFSPALRRGGLFMFAANLVALVALLLLDRRTSDFLRIARTLLSPLPSGFSQRILGLLASFAEGLGSLRQWRHLVAVAGLSLAMWFTIVLSVWSAMAALHLVLPLYAGAVLVVVISIFIMLPSAPGYIGVMQGACGIGLGLFGVESATAQAFSWLYLLTQHLPVLGFGLVYMWGENLSLGEMSRMGRKEREGQ